MSELFRATGADFGGIKVDGSIEEILVDVFGKQVLEGFKINCSASRL